MKKPFFVFVTLLVWMCSAAVQAAPDPDRRVQSILFSPGESSTTIKGTLTGRAYVDYQLKANAGQTLKVSMHPSNRSNYFNILPPDSKDDAMFIDGAGDSIFESLLPDDGIYTVRVFLVRSAARRKEHSDFTLSIALTGQPLPPLSAKVDALVPGTRFHARATIRCQPVYTQTRECEAFVIRRGFDGTATVELRWDKMWRRRILFMKGEAFVSDVAKTLSSSKDNTGNYIVTFAGDKRFEIPEALIFGG